MKLHSGDELLALIANCSEWRVQVKGALPGDVAGDDVVLWCRVPTLGEVKAILAGEMIKRGKNYSDSFGFAALIQSCYEIDSVDCTREEYVEDDIRLLFESVDAVLAMGEPTQYGSPTNSLFVTLQEASGWDEMEAEEPATSSLDLLEKIGKGRGRYISPSILTKDGEPVELFVVRTTEAQAEAARMHSDASRVKGFTGSNSALWIASIVSHVLLTERGGVPLLTTTQAEALPFGFGRWVENVSAMLTLTGVRSAETRMFRDIKPVPIDQ